MASQMSKRQFIPFIHIADCTLCEGKPVNEEKDDLAYTPPKQMSKGDLADELKNAQHHFRA